MQDLISRQAAIEALTGWETEPLDEDIVRTLEALPPVNQKQIASKLESAEIATSEGEESTMSQPKSKLDCISRQDAIEALDRIGSVDTEADREYARDIFDNLPPVTPTERIGEWIVYPLMDEGRVELECPMCGKTVISAVDYRPNFCEHCGCKMGGDTE